MEISTAIAPFGIKREDTPWVRHAAFELRRVECLAVDIASSAIKLAVNNATNGSKQKPYNAPKNTSTKIH